MSTEHQAIAKQQQDLFRKTGSVKLYLSNGPDGFGSNPFSRFKVVRGFIDDLNRMLPIRMRIHLEIEIGRGKFSGEVNTPQISFRWEFAENPMLA